MVRAVRLIITALAWVTFVASSSRFAPRYWESTILVPMQMTFMRMVIKKIYWAIIPAAATALGDQEPSIKVSTEETKILKEFSRIIGRVRANIGSAARFLMTLDFVAVVIYWRECIPFPCLRPLPLNRYTTATYDTCSY